ncbi:fasciclin domain-containing protein [Marinibactrum halimedae]|uniref:FAS1 domain-containing protein n=1 Tax=Marinibactrum halimedae TaxID=1444977 RepID=A0AA37T9G6_9GAMM|nr:fasciclin domain-containing protein [Marinibactrum halimedae]MCD9458659.1 fasciclin domain-containing protein [Marinibactrum halimedae]GLS25975.1 hypothetical protein GCM10007877_16900 [Marinibactrum halimedae]
MSLLFRKYVLQVLVVMLSLIGIVGCGSDSDNNNNDGDDIVNTPVVTIVDVATQAGTFETLIAALQATGLDATLGSEGETFTVFAPTDEAFAKLGDETIQALLNDTDTLSNILLYHVIAGSEVNASAAIASAGMTVEMANEDSVGLSLSGENLFINLSQVTSTDVEADNGIIHVIDTVLLPPGEMTGSTDNIVETAIANGNFTTLVTALQATGLDSVLSDESTEFTVFAPTDAAFDLLGAETITALLSDTDALSAILLEHVISGAAVNSISAFAAAGQSVMTAADVSVDLRVENNTLMVGNAMVEIFDVYASNGVIHVIDEVIVSN